MSANHDAHARIRALRLLAETAHGRAENVILMARRAEYCGVDVNLDALERAIAAVSECDEALAALTGEVAPPLAAHTSSAEGERR